MKSKQKTIATEKDPKRPLESYLNEIKGYRLLSASEEVELAKAIREGSAAASLLEAYDQGMLALADTELRQLRLAVCEGEQAKETFVCANLRLVVYAVKGYAKGDIPLIELIQEGNACLINAVAGFDPAYGTRFSTYAVSCIKKKVGSCIDESQRIIHLPANVKQELRLLKDAMRALEARGICEPTSAQLAEASGLQEDRVSKLQSYGQSTLSLDEPIGEEGDCSRGDMVASEDAPTPQEVAEQAMLHGLLMAEVDRLTARERMVIVSRYGLDGSEARTLAEVAELLGLTKERVRQIQDEALGKLRRPCEEACLDDYLR